MIDEQMLFAKAVRLLMQQTKHVIFNNIYRSGTRTVKCYLGSTHVPTFTEKVMQLAEVFGCKEKVHVRVRINKHVRGWGPQSSIIVKIAP